MPLTISNIEDADVPAVIELWHRAAVTRAWNDPARDISFARAAPHADILIGKLDDVIVASAMVGEDGHRGWVYYVAIDPEHQSAGFGRAMMDATENWLQARGIWKMQLMVRGDNTHARGFYEALGFGLSDTVMFQKVIG